MTTTSEFTPAAGEVTMFTTSWCSYCKNLKRQMDKAGISYREVNIEDTPGTAEIVEKINNGNQTVPTLLFADGSAATNPSLAEVKEKAGI